MPLWRSLKLDRRKVTLQRSRSQVFGMPRIAEGCDTRIYFEWGGNIFQLKRLVLHSPMLLICNIF